MTHNVCFESLRGRFNTRDNISDYNPFIPQSVNSQESILVCVFGKRSIVITLRAQKELVSRYGSGIRDPPKQINK